MWWKPKEATLPEWKWRSSKGYWRIRCRTTLDKTEWGQMVLQRFAFIWYLLTEQSLVLGASRSSPEDYGEQSSRAYLLTSNEPHVMKGTKGHHKRSDE